MALRCFFLILKVNLRIGILRFRLFLWFSAVMYGYESWAVKEG